MGWQLRGGVSRVPETDQGMDLQLRLLSGKRDPTLGRIYVLVWSNCLTLTTKCLSPELKQRCLVGVATPCYLPLLIRNLLGRRRHGEESVRLVKTKTSCFNVGAANTYTAAVWCGGVLPETKGPKTREKRL